MDILEYLRKELVDHDRVENDDEHKGEEVAKDEEANLAWGIHFCILWKKIGCNNLTNTLLLLYRHNLKFCLF